MFFHNLAFYMLKCTEAPLWCEKKALVSLCWIPVIVHDRQLWATVAVFQPLENTGYVVQLSTLLFTCILFPCRLGKCWGPPRLKMKTSRQRLSPSRGREKQLHQSPILNQKSLSNVAELSAVTAQGHHMFAQTGLCGNVTVKDEAQHAKFAWKVSVNFLTAVYSARTKTKAKIRHMSSYIFIAWRGTFHFTLLFAKFLNPQSWKKIKICDFSS